MRKEIKIGLLAIVAFACLIIGINYLKGINLFKVTNHYYVSFDNVAGVTLSSPVFANGYQIGLVQSINFDYKKLGKTYIEVKCDKSVRIPEGSYGELVTELLGGVKMNIIVDPANRSKYLASGDTLTGRLNQGLMDIAQKELVPKLQVTMERLDTLLASLNTLINDPALSGTLKNANQITSNLTATTIKLNTLLSNDIPAITGNLSHITNNFAAISDNLKKIDYASTLNKVDATLANVQLLTEKMNRQDNTLGLLLNDTGVYDNLNRTTANAASLLQDLKNHPKRYVHFSLFGKKDKPANDIK
ncbi:MAG: MlaD family protein [Phocaeicola sp.]|uniref:MlaD family protein n=1 Tax=Phocaeicola TaxID=909656 RepID=UPI00234F9415|nr:MlaD family protein [Phocaeicola oris]MCE2616185.1 MlaD family protein [Phocaeicola oris]